MNCNLVRYGVTNPILVDILGYAFKTGTAVLLQIFQKAFSQGSDGDWLMLAPLLFRRL